PGSAAPVSKRTLAGVPVSPSHRTCAVRVRSSRSRRASRSASGPTWASAAIGQPSTTTNTASFVRMTLSCEGAEPRTGHRTKDARPSREPASVNPKTGSSPHSLFARTDGGPPEPASVHARWGPIALSHPLVGGDAPPPGSIEGRYGACDPTPRTVLGERD